MLNQKVVTKTTKVVLFSGAGMSAESGIQTFRDSNGLWENYAIEDVATRQAWEKDPDLVTEFYNVRRKTIIEASPNEAHFGISRLEDLADVIVITQNIDDLHERSGSSNVVHLHGNIRYSKSSGPDQEKEYFPINGWELTAKDLSPSQCRLRPHVVWFGEDVPAYSEAAAIISEAEILIIVGTSLQVQPAAGLIHYANSATHRFIIDPKVDELDVPKEFIKVKMNASEGVNHITEQLKEIIN